MAGGNKWGWLKGTKLAGQDEHPLEPDTSPAGILLRNWFNLILYNILKHLVQAQLVNLEIIHSLLVIDY